MSIMHGIEYIGYIDPWDEERLTDEEVVRCMDCRHAAPIDGDEQGRQICWLRSAGYYAKPDDFCSYGKRREP